MPAAKYFTGQCGGRNAINGTRILPRKAVDGDPSLNAKPSQQCVAYVVLPRDIGRAVGQGACVATTVPNACLWHWRTRYRGRWS